jgi:hypothetical protein
MVKSYRLVGDKNYLPTIEETSGDYTMTAYYTLQADDNLDPMSGTAVVVQATVPNMQVDEKGNCSADVLMYIRDQATTDVVADGIIGLIKTMIPSGTWGVLNSQISPRSGASLHNVSTGEEVTTISSTDVEGLGVEPNEPIPLQGEETLRDISSKTATSLLTAAVGAVQTLTLADPTVETYRKEPFILSGPYSNLRSSDARTVVYGSNLVAATGVGDAAHSFPMLEVTDTEYNYAAGSGTIPLRRGFSIRSGDDMLSGSATLPMPRFGAQLWSVGTLLRGTNGENAGIVTTQLHIPDFDMQAPAVTVSRSSVSPEQALATSADLPTSLTFQSLKKLNS